MKWIKENEEVFYPKQTDIIEIAKQDIDYLIQTGQNNTRNRARYCTHSSVEDDVHEMIIYIKKDTYIRPHKHIGKTESFLLIDGEADVVIFNEKGKLIHACNIGKYGTGKDYYYRIPESCYHSQIFRKDTIFHEATKGPFEKKSTIFPKWAPGEDEHSLINDYLKKLDIQLKALLG